MPISPSRAAAFDILLRVETQDAYASELLHSERVDKLSAPDRGLTTEIIMGVLRWRSRLDEIIAASSSRPLAKLDREVLTALRMAAYQLQFLTRVPASAAINESVELVKRARKASAAPFTNAVLRKLAAMPRPSALSEVEDTTDAIAREYAHPHWLVERWAEQFGIERARKICRYDQAEPALSLRFDDPAAEAELIADSIKLSPGAILSSARKLDCSVGDLTRTATFREGRAAIQNEGSQLVALLLGQGSRILDCCAAPGGKTAVLAARNPQAEVIAAEIHAHRAELLRKRVTAPNVQVIQADALVSRWKASSIACWLTCPAPARARWRHNPEIKWRLQVDDLNDLHTKQVAILRAALQHLAPGGRCVYSTCSLEREEDEAVVEEVLAASPEFRLLDMRGELERLRAAGELRWEDLDSMVSGKYLRTIPGVHPCDGFFAAIIERAPR